MIVNISLAAQDRGKVQEYRILPLFAVLYRQGVAE